MALFDTITALNCVTPCPESRSLSDQQALALIIDKLATAAGIEIADITSGDLLTATDDGLCELLDRDPALSVSPETLKAIALYLATQV
jgi:hypothetical protein